MMFPLKQLFRKFYRKLHALIIPLRYKVDLIHFDKNKLNKNHGILYLVNHTTHFDPIFFINELIPTYGGVHVWVSDFVYKIWYIKTFAKWFDGSRFMKVPKPLKKEELCHPDLVENHKRDLHKLIQRTVDCLNNKKNVVIHPSGHSKRQPKEIIDHTTGVYQILKQCPNTNVVLVRMSGLWGSRFSQAHKRDPKWKNENQKWKSLLNNVILMFLLNLFIFIPKRKVLMECVLAPPDFPKQGTPEEINRYLEDFYNKQWGESGEPLNEVPDFFWQTFLKSQENELLHNINRTER